VISYRLPMQLKYRNESKSGKLTFRLKTCKHIKIIAIFLIKYWAVETKIASVGLDRELIE